MQNFTPENPYEKHMKKFCPYCNAKLGWKDWYRKKHSTEIKCRCCGEAISGDMIMVGNTKFPQKMLWKRL